jgi:hypothetical protein
MVWASILEAPRPGADRVVCAERGDYCFLRLPSSGDHVQILNDNNLISLMEVVYVQHTPTHKYNNIYDRPTVHIICKLIAENVPLPPHPRVT